jgi:hypothetical protein
MLVHRYDAIYISYWIFNSQQVSETIENIASQTFYCHELEEKPAAISRLLQKGEGGESYEKNNLC